MTTYVMKLTVVGAAKIAAATAGGPAVSLTQMSVGDGNGNPVAFPTGSETALVHEVFRTSITSLGVVSGDATKMVAEMLIPSVTGNFAIHECAVFDATGAMIAYGNFPATWKPIPTDGSSRDMTIQVVMKVGNSSVVNLVVDTNIIIATRQWVLSTVTRAFIFPGGLTGQIIKKASNASGDWVWTDPTSALNITVDAIKEEQTAAGGQVVFTLTTLSTVGTAVYVEGGRVHSFTVLNSTQIQLPAAPGAGMKVLFVQNEPNEATNLVSRLGDSMDGPLNDSRATVVGHATAADIWGANGGEIDFTGNPTVIDFPDAPQPGSSRVLHIAGTPTFTNNANIFVQGNANYTCEANDIVTIHAITVSTFRITIEKQNGTSVVGGDPLGAIKYSPTSPGAGWLKCDSSSYLQSVYPSLYAKLGLRPSTNFEFRNVVSNPFSAGVFGICAVLNTFLVWDNGSNARYTKDGTTWTVSSVSMNSAAWAYPDGARIYMWPGSGTTLYYSDNECVTWVPVTLPNAPNGTPMCRIGTRLFIKLTAAPWLLSSANGTVWTACTGLAELVYSDSDYPCTAGSSIVNGMAYMGGIWVSRPFGAVYNKVYNSPDGIAFTARVPGVHTTQPITSLTTMNDAFFLTGPPTGGSTSYLMRSTDGGTWTNVHPELTSSAPSTLRYNAYVNGIYYAIGTASNGRMFYSTTGISWLPVAGSPDNINMCMPIASYGMQSINGALSWLSNLDGTASWVNAATVVENQFSAAPVLMPTGVSASGYPGITSNNATFATYVRNNMSISFQRGNVTDVYWRTIPGAAGGDSIRLNFGTPAITAFAGSARYHDVGSRILYASATTAATPEQSMVISTPLYQYNILTEFAVPFMRDANTGFYAYIKATV